jgi:ferrous iron transport protein B
MKTHHLIKRSARYSASAKECVCPSGNPKKKIVIVGTPNVGKSSLFNNLTNSYVTVSNYPGTSVEVTSGIARLTGIDFEVIDTPGMYSLTPISEEERVAREILLYGKPDIVLHVVDTKNLERMLSFTLQLIEASLPVILVLNIMDEALKAGVEIDIKLLERLLAVPVIATVSPAKRGLDVLQRRIVDYATASDD